MVRVIAPEEAAMLQQTQSQQRPGRVVSSARVAVDFKYNGNHKMEKRINKHNFERELSAVLREAGYAGCFTVTIQSPAKGTTHTKGLRIKSTTRFGVEITWHEGSNDNCLQMCLSCPHQTTPTEFHSKLKAAHAAVEALESFESEPEVSVPAPQSATVVTLRPPQVLPDVSQETAARVEALTPPALAPMKLATHQRERFIDDETNVEIFMMEVIEHASPKGWVKTAVCSKALVRLGYSVNGTGPVIKSLVNRGHLKRPERGDNNKIDDNYMIAPHWFEKLRPGHMPPPEEKEQAPDLKPTVAAAKPAQQTVQAASNPPVSTPADRLTQLAKLAKSAEGKRKRLGEVQGEMKAIEDLIVMQTTRLETLRSEEASICSALARPEYRDAEERFAQVNKLLGVA